MSGRIKEEKVWNKGEIYRPCVQEVKEYFTKIGKIDLYNEIMKKCQCVHIYRELPNRQGHSNEKPSYFAFGFGTWGSSCHTLPGRLIVPSRCSSVRCHATQFASFVVRLYDSA